jgi:hypothetical protein
MADPSSASTTTTAACPLPPDAVQGACDDAIDSAAATPLVNQATQSTSGSVADGEEVDQRNQIKVSTNRNAYFYVDLATRFLRDMDYVELSGLGFGMTRIFHKQPPEPQQQISSSRSCCLCAINGPIQENVVVFTDTDTLLSLSLSLYNTSLHHGLYRIGNPQEYWNCNCTKYARCASTRTLTRAHRY